MFVLPQLRLAFFGGHDPNTDRLIVGAAGDQRAVLVGPHHTNPLPVARKGLHTVSIGEEIIDVRSSTWV